MLLTSFLLALLLLFASCSLSILAYLVFTRDFTSSYQFVATAHHFLLSSVLLKLLGGGFALGLVSGKTPFMSQLFCSSPLEALCSKGHISSAYSTMSFPPFFFLGRRKQFFLPRLKISSSSNTLLKRYKEVQHKISYS